MCAGDWAHDDGNADGAVAGARAGKGRVEDAARRGLARWGGAGGAVGGSAVAGAWLGVARRWRHGRLPVGGAGRAPGHSGKGKALGGAGPR